MDNPPLPKSTTPPTRVAITSVSIGFGDMIGLMIKLALASIPAAIILGVIVTMLPAFLSAMMRTM